jgi:hypothetical protein
MGGPANRARQPAFDGAERHGSGRTFWGTVLHSAAPGEIADYALCSSERVCKDAEGRALLDAPEL